MEKQALWSSKSIFILAAIGSAAWLWNLWKFPYLVYDNGWASFIIAYLVMLLLVWLWLLIWEIALGQNSRQWLVWTAGDVSNKMRWLWWVTVFLAFGILSYYVVVIGWGLDYLYYSFIGMFSGSLAWAWDSSWFFFWNILWITDWVSDKWNFSMPIFYGTLVTLILTYFFTFKSAKSVGKVILVTATLPFATLLLLALRWATLPWWMDGLAYLVNVDLQKLFELSTWTAAGWQIFFTLSVAMWVMVAYWALKKEKSELVKATLLVALWNTLISFLSAIAVFWTLGYLAHINWVAVAEVAKWWPSLVFSVIPETLTHFASMSTFFAFIFFLTVFLLAIDSAMSLVEAITLPIKNTCKKLSIEKITLWVIVLLGLASTIYMYGNGLYILDILDHYITQVWMLIIWLVELILFIYMWKKLTKFIDSHNKCTMRKIINTTYFKVSWITGIILISILLLLNINSGILIYDSYNTKDLLQYWLYPVLWAFVLALVINYLEIKK